MTMASAVMFDGDPNPWESKSKNRMELHNRYREDAEKARIERDRRKAMAAQAARERRMEDTIIFSKQAETYHKKFEHYSAMASAALVAAHTDDAVIASLDLHYFRVTEAVTVFDLFVDYHIRRLSNIGAAEEQLTIVTGRGNHSANGRPRVKPAVLARSEQRGLRVQHFSANPGVVRVFVTKDSLLTHQLPSVVRST